METLVYINYLKGGQTHIGLNIGRGTMHQRPENPNSTLVDATIEVQLNEGIDKTLISAKRVIDEGFAIIGTPDDSTLYGPDTATGRLTFMTREGYPKNSVEAKSVVGKVFESLHPSPAT